MNHFKTQQEIWKYVADGGAVRHESGKIIRFNDGNLSTDCTFFDPRYFQPYIEPVPIVTNPTSFYGGSYFRKGNRIYILGHGIPAGVTVKHETYHLIDRDRNNYSYEVEGWSSNVEPVAKTESSDCSGCGWSYRDCKCKFKSEAWIHAEVLKDKAKRKHKTKVWRWEMVKNTFEGCSYISQTENLLTEEYAAKWHPGYTKVPGSEREI